MMANTFYSCMQLLPRVLKLLLNPGQCFVDDTSIEKLLGWLKDSTKNKEYFCAVLESSSPISKFILDSSRKTTSDPEATSIAFILRLLGILCEGAILHSYDLSSTTLVHIAEESVGKGPPGDGVSMKFGELVQYHLENAVQNRTLWAEASVRCSWFEATSNIARIKAFHTILEIVEARQLAWRCLNDSSIYVQSAAQDYLALVILMQHQVVEEGNPPQSHGSDHHHSAESDILHSTQACSFTGNEHLSNHGDQHQHSSSTFEKLMRFLVVTEQNSDSDTSCTKRDCQPVITKQSVIAICRKMLAINPKTGTAVANDNHLTTKLCNLLADGNSEDATFIIIDLLQQLWLVSRLPERESMCARLVDVPTSLLEFSIESALHLATNLWLQQLQSCVKLEHFRFVVSPVLLMIRIEKEDPQGLGQYRDTLCSPIMQGICQEKKPCLQLISASLNSLIGYTKQMCLNEKEINIFGTLAVRMLECIQGTNASNTLTYHVIGSSKLANKCMDILATIITFECPSNGMTWTSDLLAVVTMILNNPETNVTLLTKALELLSKPVLSSVVFNGEEADLAFVIQKHMMNDVSWEKRDSAVGFIDRVISNGNMSQLVWVRKHNFLRFLWDRVSDSESYVRASATLSLRSIMSNKELQEELLKECQLSQEDILMELCRIVVMDTEGFARRAAVTALTSLLTHRSSIQGLLLKRDAGSCHQFKSYCLQKQSRPTIRIAEFQEQTLMDTDDIDISTDSNITVQECKNASFPTTTQLIDTIELSSKSEVSSEPYWNFVLESASRAIEDLDWEVKLRAMEFWGVLIGALLPEFVSSELNFETPNINECKQDIKETGCNDNINYNVDDNGPINPATLDHLFNALLCLCEMGLHVVLRSLKDFDRLVALSGCQLLIGLRRVLRSNSLTMQETEKILSQKLSRKSKYHFCYYRGPEAELVLSHDDLVNKRSTTNLLKCIQQLISDDLDQILHEKCVLINDYDTNPLFLLEDIVAAAATDEETEHLIDCY